MFGLSKNDSYHSIVRGAVACDGAIAGAWLGLSSDQQAFTIEAEHALTAEMRAFLRELRPGDTSGSGSAIVQRHRVVIRDAEEDYAGLRKDHALAAGIRAVTATPLIDSRFRAVGVMTLYYGKPHHPSYRTGQCLDACCQVAGRLHEVFAARPVGPMSPRVRAATEAFSRLLPIADHGNADEADYRTMGRHLDLLLQELSERR